MINISVSAVPVNSSVNPWEEMQNRGLLVHREQTIYSHKRKEIVTIPAQDEITLLDYKKCNSVLAENHRNSYKKHGSRIGIPNWDKKAIEYYNMSDEYTLVEVTPHDYSHFRRDYTEAELDSLQYAKLYKSNDVVFWYGDNEEPATFISAAFPDMEIRFTEICENHLIFDYVMKNGDIIKEYVIDGDECEGV